MMLHLLLLLLPALASGGVSVPKQGIAHGVRMPVASIGTGGLEASKAAAITAAWMKLGGRGVDTAYIYRNQAAVAKAIADAGVDRKDVFITSKVPGCSNVASFVEQDLRLLSTGYIDLMLIHFPRGDCAAAWATLEDYHARGILKAIGVSNFRRNNIESLMKTAKVRPAVNQVQLNVLEHDDDTIACARDKNITIEAFSPLGRAGHSGDIPGNQVIQSIAAAHNVSSYQIALKWILQHGHVLTFQSASQAHQKQDADLFGFDLTRDEMSKLDALQNDKSPVIMM